MCHRLASNDKNSTLNPANWLLDRNAVTYSFVPTLRHLSSKDYEDLTIKYPTYRPLFPFMKTYDSLTCFHWPKEWISIDKVR